MKRRRQMIMEAHGAVCKNKRCPSFTFIHQRIKFMFKHDSTDKISKRRNNGGFHRLQLPLGNNLPQYGNMKMENHVVVDFSFWNTQFAWKMKFFVTFPPRR
jgi:hypothetical protein